MTLDSGRAEPACVWSYRRPYQDAPSECGVLEILAPFDPRAAGTPPLGLDLPGSDIDVRFFAPDVHEFTHAVWCAFSDAPGFVAKQWANPPRSMVVSFEAAGWRIEVYGEAIPVEQQRGWRHFIVEQRLLTLGGNGFRTAVLTLRLPGFELTVSRRKTTGGLAWLAPGDVPINESYEALTTPRLHAVKDVRSVWLSNT